ENGEAVRKQAEAEVDRLPAYAALRELAEEGGISEAEAVEAAGRETVEAVRERHGDIFGGGPAALDALADSHGYESGAALLEDLAQAPGRDKAVEDRRRWITAEMAGRERDQLAHGAETPADGGYHNQARLEMLARQREALERLANGQKSLDGSAEAQFEEILKAQEAVDRSAISGRSTHAWSESREEIVRVGKHWVKKTRPGKMITRSGDPKKEAYRERLKRAKEEAEREVGAMPAGELGQRSRVAKAERTAGREAARAAKTGDYAAALDALERQIQSHAVVTEMYRAEEELDRFQRGHGVRKLVKSLDAMLEPYREPLKQLVDRYGVARRPVKAPALIGRETVAWETPRELRPESGDGGLLLPELAREEDEFEGGPDNIRDFTPDLRDFIPEWLQRLEKPEGLEDWRDLSVQQARELAEAIDLIQDVGRGELTALKTGEAETIDQAVTEIVAILEQAPERPALRDQDTWRGRGLNALDRFLLSGVTADSLFSLAEGNRSLAKKSLLQKMVERLRNYEAEESSWTQAIFDRLKPHLEALADEAGKLDRHLQARDGLVEGLPFPEALSRARGKRGFTGEMLIAAALNSGNGDTLHQLREGYGWDENAIAALRKQLSSAAWRAIENIWAEMDQLYPDMANVAFQAVHKRPPKEPGQAFTSFTSDGKAIESKGGYYPLAYDGLISRRQGAFQDVSNAKAMAQAGMTYAANKPPSGFRLARARGDRGEFVYKGPPVLSLSVMPRHFSQVLHFITHARAVWELDRITRDPRFQEAFVSRNGQDKYRAARQWLNYVANPRPTAKTGGLMNFLHDRFITSVLGWNVFSAQKQRLGLFTALAPLSEAITEHGKRQGIAGDLGGTAVALKYIGQAMWDYGLTGNLGLINERFQAIKEMSPVMKSRDESGATKELRDRVKAIAPLSGDISLFGKRLPVNNVRNSFFKLIQLADRATAGPLWWASFRLHLDGQVADNANMTDAERKKAAVDFADSIAMTQTSPFRVDHSPLQRGDDVIAKFASVCISGVMQPGNMLYQKV
ncbi:MAG: hypothetical protein LBV15_01555, partial [Planctomycetota bacterium]|nr:hypothetical protein [Planctomycetota bacterium]